jgi:hypothetical protein
LRIRIIRKPSPRDVEGYDVNRFEVGELFDVGPRLADLLVIGGYAIVEMRRTERGRGHSRADDSEQ